MRMFLALGFAISILFSCVNANAADWLDDMLSDTVAPSAGSASGGNVWAYGGRVKVAPTRKSLHPFSITPPHLYTTPCGFDMFFGGYSMLDSDQLVALAQGVISAAPAYAFNLALGQLCSSCKTTMQNLNSIIMKLNNIGMDSCSVLQLAGQKIGLDANRQAAQEGETSGLSGAINNSLESLNKDLDDLMDKFKVNSGKNSSMTKELAKLIVPPDNRAPVYLWSQIMELKGICRNNGGHSCSAWTASYNGVPRQLFSSPSDYIGFLRAIVGDFRFERAADEGAGNCAESATELFGQCFTSWLTGGRCGECEPKKLLAAEVLSPVLHLESDIIDPNNDPNVDWGITLCNGDAFSFVDDFSNNATLFYAPVGYDCAQRLALAIPAPAPTVRQEFEELSSNIAQRATNADMGATEASLVYSTILSPYYKAIKIAHSTDSSLEEIIREEVSRSIGLAYAVGLLSSVIDTALDLLDEADLVVVSTDREALSTICKGCGKLHLSWIADSKTELSRFKSFVMKKAQGQLNKSRGSIMNALEGYDVSGAENVPTDTRVKEGRQQ